MQEGKANKHVDETSCGPLCQHPLCWASNRRVERGLPRLLEARNRNMDISLKDDLPTLKVVDLFGGENALPHSYRHGRSSSAPLLENKLRQTSQESSPLTPNVSPVTTGLPADSKKQPFKAPVLKKIEVHELVDWPNDWSDNFIGSHFYLWCTTRDSKKQTDAKFLQSTGCLNSKNPEYVRVKDVTEDLLPSSVQNQHKQKKKKHGSHKTPTGGRPYISPSKGSLPRSYLKSPREDEISQLLTLPREVLLQVIDHANNSDIYDKDRVHKLLQKVLPQIHFQQHVLAQQKELARKRNTAGTPLEESGILQNKKVQLKEGPKVTSDQVPLVQSKLFMLDNNVDSEVQNNEKKMEEKLENENTPEKTNDVKEKITKKILAPLKGVRPEPSKSLTKLTSISTRTLSPLQAGTSPTKPFNYSAKPLDWTLGPLPSKEKKVVFKPAVTPPHSEKASTLHVTIPSVMSPDRMSLLASATSRDRSPYPPSRNKSPYHQSQSMNSSLTPEENPVHAISSSLSTNVPLAPLSTPAYLQKHGSFKKESSVPSKSSTTNHEDRIQESLPKTPVNTPFHTENQQLEQNLGAIQERRSETSSPSITESVNIPLCIKQQSPVSESVNNQSCMSPWEEFNSIAVQPSEKMNPSPVQVMTPALTGVTTPDHWPSIDEEEYLNSATEKLAEEVISPAAPPPSPEPVVFESDGVVTDESQNVSKSMVTTSLTPLQEEEDEEEALKEDAVNKEAENTGVIQNKLDNMNNVDNEQNATETNCQSANHLDNVVTESNQGMEDNCVEDNIK